MTREDPNLLSRLRTPPAPQQLKERTLRVARLALADERPPSLEERLWHSQVLRLAWLATVAVLLAINLMIPPGGGSRSRSATVRDGVRDAISSGDVDALPEPEWTGGDRAAVLCVLLDDCDGARFDPRQRGDRG